MVPLQWKKFYIRETMWLNSLMFFLCNWLMSQTFLDQFVWKLRADFDNLVVFHVKVYKDQYGTACTVSKVTKSVIVHPRLLIWSIQGKEKRKGSVSKHFTIKMVEFTTTKREARCLLSGGYQYTLNQRGWERQMYWRCVDRSCLGRATTDENDQVIAENHAHDHPAETAK